MKLLISALWMVLVTTAQTQAQDNAWLQIDAQPTEAEAEESARYYESFLPDIAGFALASGWYVIALGPYSEITAQNLLQVYRDSGQGPGASHACSMHECFGAPPPRRSCKSDGPGLGGVTGMSGLVLHTPS